MGFIILNKIFKRYIINTIHKHRKHKNHSISMIGEELLGWYHKYYFIFSFAHKIIKINPIYPRRIFSKLSLRYIYRLFTIWFLYRPLLKQIAKLLEWILMYLNFNSKINVFLLSNQSITANFIARYLLMALRLKFNYYDMIIPIKKSLGRQMYARRWVSYKHFVRKEWNEYQHNFHKLRLDRKLYYKTLIDVTKSLIIKKFLKRRFKKQYLWVVRRRKIMFFNVLKNNLLNFLKIFKNNNIYFLKKKNLYFNKINIIKRLKFKKKSIWKKYKLMLKRLNLLNLFNKINYTYYYYLFNNEVISIYIENILNIFEFFCKNVIVNFLKNQIYLFPTKKKTKKIKFIKRRKRLYYKWKSLFYNYFNSIYSKNYKSFMFDHLKYKFNNKQVVEFNKDLNLRKKELNKDLIMIPLKNKLKKMEVFDNFKSVLYGYKFHFSGRFTRKQKAASLWFLKGSNPVSSTAAYVDYGFYTIKLRYSVCSVKIWLYKNQKAPTKNFKII